MNHHARPYGVGLAHRHLIHRQAMAHRGEIDLLELTTETYLQRWRRVLWDPHGVQLREATAHFPCVAHGISMSLGSVEPLDCQYLQGTRQLLEQTGVELFSEHLAFHRIDGADLTVFLSMPFHPVSVDWIERNYWAARDVLGRPFALENVSYYFAVPDCPLREAEFVAEVLDRTDATLLLDVTNVYNNCTNHRFDPLAYLRTLPGDRVSQIHLAGGHFDDGFLIDSHSYPVMEPVWELFDAALQQTAAEIVILERDDRFEPFSAVLDDIRRARTIFRRHRSPRPTGPAPVGNPRESAPPADPADPALADLRNFQRALMREIRDPEFRSLAAANLGEASREYPLSPDWLARWRGCSPQQLDQMAARWRYFQEEEAEIEADYRRHEWQQWVQMGGG